MRSVTFWSPVHGQASTTSNALATAFVAAIQLEQKTLLTHTHYTRSTLEASLMKNLPVSTQIYDDLGLDALARLAKSNRLKTSSIPDYTHTLLKRRLDLLTGTTKKDPTLFENMSEVIPTVFELARKEYDLTIIDAHSGSRDQVSNKAMQQADLIVVNLTQNISVLDRFFNKEDWHESLNSKPYIIVLSQYDEQSRYSVKNIQRKYKHKGKIYTVPYNSQFRDSCNDGDARDFFLRNAMMKKTPKSNFISEVTRLSKAIMTESVDIQKNESKSLLMKIKGVS